MMTRSLLLTLALLVSLLTYPLRAANPFETLPDGGLRHTFSGFIFPKSIGDFERVNTKRYNEEGSDVSAGYNVGSTIVATVYAYPAPADTSTESFAREWASKRGEVFQVRHDVKALSEAEANVVQEGKTFTGRRALFSFRDSFVGGIERDLKSQLLVFRDGAVFIEYRITYPLDDAEAAEKQIERFIRDWSWR
jgi:hypothetical protein